MIIFRRENSFSKFCFLGPFCPKTCTASICISQILFFGHDVSVSVKARKLNFGSKDVHVKARKTIFRNSIFKGFCAKKHAPS